MKLKLSIFLMGAVCLSIFVGFVVSRNDSHRIAAVEEENQALNKSETTELSPYFKWKVDWQELADVDIAYQLTGKALENHGNKIITRQENVNYDYVVNRGATIPQLQLKQHTFALTGDGGGQDLFPEFIDVNPVSRYTFKNIQYWEGLGDGPFNGDNYESKFNNWPNITKWKNWPSKGVFASAFVISPLGPFGSGNSVNYNFKPTSPTSTSTSASIVVKIDDNYSIPSSVNSRTRWAMGWLVKQPQVVKAIFKDIDNPEGDNLVNDVTYGNNFELGDSLEITNKDIPTYDFVNSQVILGPTIKDLITMGHYQKDGKGYIFDEKGSGEQEKKNDKSWSTTLTTQQKGIIFWYKKKLPDIGFTKDVDKTTASLNEKLSYTLEIENKASATAELKNAKVVDILPEGMSKPENIRLGGEILQEGPENSERNSYTWNAAERKMTIYVKSVLKNERKVVTYDSMITSGDTGDKKINKATLTGENTEQEKSAEATVNVNKLLKVEFESNGGSLVETQMVQSGKKAIRPTDPTKENQLFIGWYEDKGLSKVWDFNTLIVKDRKLYAKWRRTIVDPGDGVTPIIPKNPDGSDKETNQTENDFRIQYVSDFDFGEQVVTAKAANFLADGDYGDNSKKGLVRVPSFISIIDDRTAEQLTSWEIRAKASNFKNREGKLLKGARLLLSDVNVANTGENRPFPQIGELNLTEGSTVATTKGRSIGEGTWSMGFGSLGEDLKSSGVKLDIKKGAPQSTLSSYHSIIDWELVVGP